MIQYFILHMWLYAYIFGNTRINGCNEFPFECYKWNVTNLSYTSIIFYWILYFYDYDFILYSLLKDVIFEFKIWGDPWVQNLWLVKPIVFTRVLMQQYFENQSIFVWKQSIFCSFVYWSMWFLYQWYCNIYTRLCCFIFLI